MTITYTETYTEPDIDEADFVFHNVHATILDVVKVSIISQASSAD